MTALATGISSTAAMTVFAAGRPGALRWRAALTVLATALFGVAALTVFVPGAAHGQAGYQLRGPDTLAAGDLGIYELSGPPNVAIEIVDTCGASRTGTDRKSVV